MAQELLYRSDVVAGFEKMCGGSLPKAVSDVNEMKNSTKRIVLLNKESGAGRGCLFPRNIEE